VLSPHLTVKVEWIFGFDNVTSEAVNV